MEESSKLWRKSRRWKVPSVLRVYTGIRQTGIVSIVPDSPPSDCVDRTYDLLKVLGHRFTGFTPVTRLIPGQRLYEQGTQPPAARRFIVKIQNHGLQASVSAQMLLSKAHQFTAEAKPRRRRLPEGPRVESGGEEVVCQQTQRSLAALSLLQVLKQPSRDQNGSVPVGSGCRSHGSVLCWVGGITGMRGPMVRWPFGHQGSEWNSNLQQTTAQLQQEDKGSGSGSVC